MKETLRVERWINDNNQEEIHYFIGNMYIIGFNPKLVSSWEVSRLLHKMDIKTSNANNS